MAEPITTSRPLSCPLMIGRSPELDRLRAAMDRAAAGHPHAVVVGGEAGVGKTRLLQEFASTVRSAGVRVWWGRCPPLADGPLPYVPIVDLLRSVADDVGSARLRAAAGAATERLAVLSPELVGDAGGDAGVDARAAAVTAQPSPHPQLHRDLLDLFERLAGDPAVVVLEDLHWADRSTRALLSTLIGGMRRGRLLVLCSYRDDEVAPDHPVRSLLAELTRAGVDRVELGRLDRAECAAQMAGIMRTEPSDAVAQRVFERSGGNPFLIEELVAAGVDGHTVPSGLRDILLSRVRRLPPGAQTVLRAVALAGRGADHLLLEHVTGAPPQQLLASVRAAVDEHLLVVDGERYTFRHALVGEAIATEILPGERIRLHRGMAEVLGVRVAGRSPTRMLASTLAADRAEVAYHWTRAGEPAHALVAAVAAGLAAERAHAMAEARRLFEQAIELWWQAPQVHPDVGIDLVDLYRHAAEAERVAGDFGRALCYIDEAIARAGPDGDPMLMGALHERRGLYQMIDAEDASIEAYETAVALVPDTATLVRAQVLGGLARGLLMATRLPESRQWAERALEVARRTGARTEQAHALATLGYDLTQLGEPEQGIAHLREAVALSTELDYLEGMYRAYVNLSGCLVFIGRLAESADVALDGAELLRRRGASPAFHGCLSSNAGHALFHLGRWDEIPPPESMSNEDNPYAAMQWCSAAMLHTAKGSFAEAERLLHAALRVLGPDGLSSMRADVNACLTELSLWRGQPMAARDVVAQERRIILESADGPTAARLLAAACRATADLAAADRARANRTDATPTTMSTLDGASLAALAEDLAERARLTPYAQAYLHQARAELTRARGEADSGAWAGAAAGWSTLDCPYHVAYARFREAETLLPQSGGRRQAGPILADAHRIVVRLDARPLREEIERLARRSRLDLPADHTEEPGGTGVAPALTPREKDVLALIGEGRTNQQIANTLFISKNTVAIHVSRILAKLGVANRAAAACVAHNEGLGR